METFWSVVGVGLGLVVGLAALAIPIYLVATSPAAGLLYVLGPGIICGLIWLLTHALRPASRWWTDVLERRWWN